MRPALSRPRPPCSLASCAAQKKEPPPKPFVVYQVGGAARAAITGEHRTCASRRPDGGLRGCNRLAGAFVQDTVGSRFIAIGRTIAAQGCEQALAGRGEPIAGSAPGSLELTILTDR